MYVLGINNYCILHIAVCVAQWSSIDFSGKLQLLKQQKLGKNLSDLCDSDSAENYLSLCIICMGIAAEHDCKQFSLIVIWFLQIYPT